MICGLLLITTGRNRALIYLANKQKGVNTEQVLRLAFIWSQDIVALWNRYVFGFREAPQSKNDKKGDIVPFRWPSPPYIWCLKKRANCDKCVFATKQRMFDSNSLRSWLSLRFFTVVDYNHRSFILSHPTCKYADKYDILWSICQCA